MRRLALLSLAALAAFACTKATTDIAPVAAADAGADVEAPAADAAVSSMPYPAGPYGTSIGDVVPDLDVLGYALSPTERDPGALPFRRLRLSDVRRPECTCMVLLWDVSGFTCPWSAVEGQTISSAIDSDPSFCAVELLDGNFDTIIPNNPAKMGPTTRADLDAFTGAARQNYPVGIATAATRHALGGPSMWSFPVNFVVDPRTMRLLDVQPGLAKDFIGRLKRTCAGAPRAIDALATGIAGAKQMVLAGGQLHVLGSAGLVRLDVSGGTPVPVTGPSAPPTAIATDGTSVVWIVGAEVGRVGTGVLATGPAAYTSVAVDDTYVYLTRSDGVVSRVPLAGGPEETLLTGEASPTSIVAPGTTVVFLASGTGAIVRFPKGGGAREIVAPVLPIGGTNFTATSLWPFGAGFVAALRTASDMMLVPYADGALAPGPPFGVSPGFSALFMEDQRFLGATRGGDGEVTIVFDDPPQDGKPVEEAFTARWTTGQPDVVAVTADASYEYWLTASGEVRRRHR